MEHFAILNIVTRQIVSHGVCQEGMAKQQWCQEGQIAIKHHGTLESGDHYITAKGKLVRAPQAPGNWARFDPERRAWFDPRDDAARAEALKSAKNDAVDAVNSAAGRANSARGHFAGQEEIYALKCAEAAEYVTSPIADGRDFPLLASEVGITAPEVAQLAQIWLNLADLRRKALIEKEAARRAHLAAIEQAKDVDELEGVLAGILNGAL